MRFREIITEAESVQRVVALYPGRFQPGHIGHMRAYQWLAQNFDDAYIVTSDKVDPPRSPFNFQEKRALFMHAGVPSDRIIQVKNPYRADEIVQKFDPDTTALVFGVSEKDMAEDPRFSFKPKKDGSPAYLQPYKENQNRLEPLSKHGYVATVPTFRFDVAGKPMRSATEFRANFAKATEQEQAEMIKDLYGSYSERIHQLMREKIV